MRSNRAIIELFTSSHHIRNGTAVLLSSLVAHLIEIRHNKDTVKAERIRMRYRDLYSNGVTGAVTIMNCLGFHGNADVLSLTFSLITAENMVTTNTNAAHELEPYGEPWRAASDTISPVFRQRLYNTLSNRSLYSILEHIPWKIFSPRAKPIIMQSPSVLLRLIEAQMTQPKWNSNLEGKLQSPLLPSMKKRRLFILKAPSSRDSVTRGFSKLKRLVELNILKAISRQFGHFASSTEKIWRAAVPDLRSMQELANFLQYIDIWFYNHLVQESSARWLFDTEKINYDPSVRRHIQILTSFGTLDLHMVSTNIGSVGIGLSQLLILRDIPGIESISIYAAMGPHYSNMLNIEPSGDPNSDEDDIFPRWVSFSIEELAARIESTQQRPLQTNVERWMYATQAIRRNNKPVYQIRLENGFRSLPSENAFQSYLERVAPGTESSRIWKINDRNKTCDWYMHDGEDKDFQPEDFQQEDESEADEDMEIADVPRTPEPQNPLTGFNTSDILPYSPSESPERPKSAPRPSHSRIQGEVNLATSREASIPPATLRPSRGRNRVGTNSTAGPASSNPPEIPRPSRGRTPKCRTRVPRPTRDFSSSPSFSSSSSRSTNIYLWVVT
jgi:hypothetical protein